ncbi:hypothetical protein CPB84DRAFT_1847416 [Gymnopilus junonius]|uniref:Gylcosyl hydrolase 115 C-terminal domain-containing protein n=1 Tax=Gymnopilus junonius TaxID=109634 RepID=A0A9P5NKE9_GYMJU|nr:hypothetical protein CPB84DRAFT_1847416 [Gymnopilus junonius]
MLGAFARLLGILALLHRADAIGQTTCVSFTSSKDSFAIVNNGNTASILISPDDWPGVQRAAADFQADIQRVTSVKPSLTNYTVAATPAASKPPASAPIIIGTLGKSPLIDHIVNASDVDVSSIQGKWESFMTRVVSNPLPGVSSAYLIIGADKRGTVFALYDHSEQFGVSPWYWWADVPTTTHSSIFVANSGCAHGSPSVKYRGIFLNDEQPALQNWAMEKFTNGTGAPLTNSPFNHLFYTKLFELILRLKANYLWPAQWSSAFGTDDPQNQFLADWYGVAMGTSHQEPMMRSTPVEFSLFGSGPWDYTTNSANINKFWLEGAERARPFESVYTMGMRGFGDLPLSETTDIGLLKSVIANQTDILQSVYNSTDVSELPQIWCLYKEVEGYYDDGMTVADYITLLWTDDNWGNIRRFPTASERNRTGGAGVYYHVDYVGSPRDFKWITSTQIEKVYQQLSLAIQRQADRLWVLNVGDLKPYEREIEFFLTYAWNSTIWTQDNLHSFLGDKYCWQPDKVQFEKEARAGRCDDLQRDKLPRWRNGQISKQLPTAIYNSLSKRHATRFLQLVHHPVLAGNNVNQMYVTAAKNGLRASQAFLSTNQLAETTQQLFENDFNFEQEYHTILNGKWDQPWIFYWQQPMTNTMPSVTRVQSKKQALPGVMRIAPEGTLGAWPGDNPNQCSAGYNCGPPTLTIDNFSPIANRYVDVGAGGPAPFTFSVSSNVTWLQFSPSKGSISPNSPEQRVFFNVDWSKLSAGNSFAQISFSASAPGEFPLGPEQISVVFVATKNTPSSFVEGTGVVSIEAAHATRKTVVQDISWTEIPGLGRTLSAITPLPLEDTTFSAGAGPTLEYDFFTFDSKSGNGSVTAYVLLTTALNSNTEQNPLSYSIQIDSLPPVTVVPIGTEVPGGLPNGWDGVNGWVANNIISTPTNFAGVNPGAHTLKISMVTPAVAIQKIIIDTGGLQASYLGPPESIVM